MIDISWDIIFFGVFMVLNLLQTLLLTIFILKVRKSKKAFNNGELMRKNLSNMDLQKQPRYSTVPFRSGVGKEDYEDIERTSKIVENIYEAQDDGYMDMTQGKGKVQELGIYEDLKPGQTHVEAEENSFEESDTYEKVPANSIVYDKLAHMGVTSRKADCSYDTVKIKT